LGFLKSQSIYYLHNASKPQLEATGSFFKFDGEFSVVSLDFDVVGRKEEIDHNAVKVKKEVERVGRMKFRSVSSLQVMVYPLILYALSAQRGWFRSWMMEASLYASSASITHQSCNPSNKTTLFLLLRFQKPCKESWRSLLSQIVRIVSYQVKRPSYVSA